MDRKFTLILNRESGTAKDEGPENLQKNLETWFAEAGVDLTTRVVVGDDLVKTLEELRDAEIPADAVVVAGGDGTVAAAAMTFLGSEIPLGVLPLGTMNLVARDFGVPIELPKAVEALAQAPAHKIDVLMLNGKVCLCNLVLGFYPALALRQEEYHGKTWIMKVFQTLHDTLFAYAQYSPLKVTVETDQGKKEYRTRFITITSNRYEELFGLLPQHESLDRGYMSVYISENKSVFSLLRASLSFLSGRLNAIEDLTNYQTEYLEITSRRRHLPVMIDGEIERTSPPLNPEIRKKALNVLLPRVAAVEV